MIPAASAAVSGAALALFTLGALLAASLPAAAQGEPVLEDDFEAAVVGERPPEWFSPAVGPPGVTAEEDGAGGNRCALLELGPGDGGFANLIRSLPLGAMAGQRVRLTGAVRVEGGRSARAQLWLRFDYADGTSVLADNMHERPIRTGGWEEHAIVADARDRPGEAVVGCMAFGEGRVFLDDVRLAILGPAPTAAAGGPRPLAERGRANLAAFTRLLGAVRYFHPSDEAAACDWEAFAVRGVRRVEGAEGPAELAAVLRELFAPVAPTVAVYESGSEPARHPALARPEGLDRLWLRSWRHLGVGPADGSQAGPYRSWRSRRRVRGEELPEGLREPADDRAGPELQAVAGEQSAKLRQAWVLFLCHYAAAWEQLAPRDRRALELVEVRGCAYEAAGRILGVRRSNMKMIIFRSRKRIAARMRLAMRPAASSGARLRMAG